jgi:1,4-dihydroxy-2-naphthoate octaprenyltransferase
MLKTYIEAARLRTLPLSISGIIVAGFLAQFTGVFDLLIFILSILVTLSFQILSNYANDYGDGVKGTDNENRIGPKRAIQSGAISPAQLKRVIFVNALVSVLLSLTLIYVSFGRENLLLTLAFIGLGAASIWAAIRYTVGEKAYGYRGLGDVFVFLFFGLVSVLGGYFLYAQNFQIAFLLPGVSIGLLSTAVLNLNNLRDRDSDKISNKITVVVSLGVQRAKVYHTLLVLIPLLASLFFNYFFDLLAIQNFIYLIAFLPLIQNLVVVWNNTEAVDLDPELKKVALSTFLYSLLFGISISF